jgi:hypothetical protein
MIKAAAVYLLRTLLSLVIVGLLFFLLLKKTNYEVVWNGAYLIAVLSQLDIFHHLLYALFVMALVVLPLTLGVMPVRPTSRRSRRLLIPLLLAALVGLVLAAAPHLARPALPCGFHKLFAPLYVAFNVIAWLWSGLFGAGTKWNATLRRLAPAADLLAPLPLWAAYRDRHRGFAWGLQLAPLGVISLVSFLPWLALPLDEIHSYQNPSPALRSLSPVPYYQIAVDPADGQWIGCDGLNHLDKIDSRSGRPKYQATVETQAVSIQGFGFDARSRELVFVDPSAARTFWFDATELRPTRVTPIAPARLPRLVGAGHGNRTQWSAAGGILITFTFDPGFYLLNREGSEILFNAEPLTGHGGAIAGQTADAVIDANRRKVHWITTGGAAVDFDVDRLAVDHVLRLPSTPERIALDAGRHRLFITLPIVAQVLVVDTRTYQPLTFIPSFPGVRAVTVDEERDRLYLGGFSPVLEIRSLTDYSLQHRVTIPAWTRWIGVDSQREKVAITSHLGGAWELDLRLLSQKRAAAFWKRIDPAYPIFRVLARLARRIILLTHPLSEAFS